MSDWKLDPPQAPPGPVDKPDATDPAWAKWIKDQLEIRLPVLFPTTMFVEVPNYEASLTVEPGELVTFPLEGDNPTPWAPDGGRIDVEFTPGPMIDLTRYKRVYPGIVLLDFRKYTVTVRYLWGNNLFKAFFVGGRYDLTYTWLFWKPEGQPRRERDRAVYRFKKTSYGQQIKAGASIGAGVVPLGVSIGVEGKVKVEDPQPPPPNDPKAPDQKDINRPRNPVTVDSDTLLKVLSASKGYAPGTMPTPARELVSGGPPGLEPVVLDAEIASILGVFPRTLQLGESLVTPGSAWGSPDVKLGWYLENRDLIDEGRMVWVTAAQIRRAAEDAPSQRADG